MIKSAKRILVYGKDARTDAIIEACTRSNHRPEIFVCTEFNNPGFLRKCKKPYILPKNGLLDLKAMVDYAKAVKPDFVIVGPEEPLEAGLVDALEELKISSFGPYSALARIETSKSWARELLDQCGEDVNPDYRIFTSTAGLREFLKELGDFVVKPDGLTGGKGVRVSGEHLSSIDDAIVYSQELLATHKCIVVEQKLEGEEFSLQTISDGYSSIHCPIVQDHKRAFEGNTGPNTGGMGSYSCPDFSLPFLRASEVEEARRISSLVLEKMREVVGKPYRGVLYGNYIATSDGLKLIEYNARFADPESTNVLPILDTDFVEICEAVLRGALSDLIATFRPKATVCKYVVPQNYPLQSTKNGEISLRSELLEQQNLQTYFAAVNQTADGKIQLTGSRAVAFVGIGETLAEAERLAEDAASSVEGPVRHRRDIGSAALIQSRILHMEEVREHNLSTRGVLGVAGR